MRPNIIGTSTPMHVKGIKKLRGTLGFRGPSRFGIMYALARFGTPLIGHGPLPHFRASLQIEWPLHTITHMAIKYMRSTLAKSVRNRVPHPLGIIGNPPTSFMPKINASPDGFAASSHHPCSGIHIKVCINTQ